MSKYNIYAQRLDEAYKTALEEYSAAYEKMGVEKKKAARSLDAAKLHNDTAGIMRAKADDMEADAAFKEAEKRIWDGFTSKRQELRDGLQKELRADSTASPDAVDTNALALLESGIMTPDDYYSFVDRFDNNSTMTRLIGKFAQDAADNMKDDRAARAALIQVAQACKDGQSSVMREFDGLCKISDYCCGRSREGRTDRPEYIMSMGARWPELSAQVIENF